MRAHNRVTHTHLAFITKAGQLRRGGWGKRGREGGGDSGGNRRGGGSGAGAMAVAAASWREKCGRASAAAYEVLETTEFECVAQDASYCNTGGYVEKMQG